MEYKYTKHIFDWYQNRNKIYIKQDIPNNWIQIEWNNKNFLNKKVFLKHQIKILNVTISRIKNLHTIKL